MVSGFFDEVYWAHGDCNGGSDTAASVAITGVMRLTIGVIMPITGDMERWWICSRYSKKAVYMCLIFAELR